MTSRGSQYPDGPADEGDLIERAVAAITDAEVDEHLSAAVAAAAEAGFGPGQRIEITAEFCQCPACRAERCEQ